VSALKKRKIRGNKKGQVSGTSKKIKSETRGKNGQVSDSRIRSIRYPPERKEKENIEHLILFKKLQSARKVCTSSPYTIHSPHMHILILTCFSGSMV